MALRPALQWSGSYGAPAQAQVSLIQIICAAIVIAFISSRKAKTA